MREPNVGTRVWCPNGCGKKVVFSPPPDFYRQRYVCYYKALKAWRCERCGKRFSRLELQEKGLMKAD